MDVRFSLIKKVRSLRMADEKVEADRAVLVAGALDPDARRELVLDGDELVLARRQES